MSADDDDFWENDDFIATIENVVKKAEEASAARHGGSQPNDSAGHFSLAITSTTIDSRIGERNLASHSASPCGRCYQAEQQLHDLRRSTGSQGTLQSPLHQQQLEVERLSALLLFKDHEIVEANRIREEREGQLKKTVAEVTKLRDELHQLKNLREPGIGRKIPRGANVGVVEESVESFHENEAVNFVDGRNNLRVPQQNHDPWSPPWVTDGSSDGVQGKSSKTSRHVSEKTGSDGREPLKSEKATNRPNGDKPRVSGASIFATANPAEAGPSLGCLWRASEINSSLQQLWGLKGTTKEGHRLLSELYTICGHDMYTLLSKAKSESPLNVKSSLLGEDGKQESVAISEKFHVALRKVANGLAQPSVIIEPLLKFCKLDDVTYRECSLHVLRRVLQIDGACRRELLLRKRHVVAQHPSSAAAEANLEQPRKLFTGMKWFVKSLPKGTGPGKVRQVVEFSSPRISLDSVPGYEYVRMPENVDLVDPSVDLLRQEYPGLCDGLLVQGENRINTNGDAHRLLGELNLFVKWMLHLALTDSSPGVKFEAVAIVRILIVSSGPYAERAMFESVLRLGGVEQLLKETAGVDVQLQAVQIIHHLLHCPAAISQVCCGAESESMPLDREHVLTKRHGHRKGEPEQYTASVHVNHGIPETLVAMNESSKAEATTFRRAQQSSFPEIFWGEILEGLAECLKSSENYRRGNPLHRNVIRLLTFVVTCGEFCAVNLLQARLTYSSNGPLDLDQTCKGDPKVEGFVGPENSSGERVVSMTFAGSTRLVGLDLCDDPGGGIRLGQLSSLVGGSTLQNIVQSLLVLMDRELDFNGSQGWNDADIVNGRDQHLMHEVLSLLCHLCSHRCLSAEVLRHLTSSKLVTRLTLSVANRLLMKRPLPIQDEIGSGQYVHPRMSDVSVCKFFSKFSADLTEVGRAFSELVVKYLGDSRESC